MSTHQPVDGSIFADDWLTQREPVDHRSRAHGLTREAARFLRRRNIERPTVVDLGTGRGSNLRYLAPRLATPQHWRLVDHDRALIDAIATDIPPGLTAADRIETKTLDLAGDIAPVIDQADLVTAAALFDLVSIEWIDRLIAACASQRSGLLVALSIDGTIRFSGEIDPLDAVVRRALVADQQRDKGLGAALGAHAPSVLIDRLSVYGFAISAMPSPWHLTAAEPVLAAALIDGWRNAAIRQCPDRANALNDWATRRTNQLRTGVIDLYVGHTDVLGLPMRADRIDGLAQSARRRKSRS